MGYPNRQGYPREGYPWEREVPAEPLIPAGGYPKREGEAPAEPLIPAGGYDLRSSHGSYALAERAV